jgi:cathepsin L
MRNAIVLITVCLFGLNMALPSKLNVEKAFDQHWQNFKVSYNKEYESEHHELMRRLIWEENLRMIQDHNLEYDMGKHTYSLGMNEYGDMTHEEFKHTMLSVEVNMTTIKERKGLVYMAPENMGSVPDSVDWRSKGYVTPVKNQARCGSCWSFSATGALEGQYFRRNGKLVSFSEQQLVDCSHAFGNNGCNGGLMDSAFEYLEKYGSETEDDYPYTAQDGHCHYNQGKVVANSKVKSYTDIEHGSESALVSALATVGPVSVAIDAGHPSFQFYRHGVYNERMCSATHLNHGVLSVGYGNEHGQDYFLVKNSWGKTWGRDGFILMSRNVNNQCGIASMASYPNL